MAMSDVKPDPRFPPTQHWALLAQMVKENGWTTGAELGLLKGKTFIYLLQQCPDLTLIGVDQWRQLPPSDEDGAEHYQKFNMAHCEAMVRERARPFGRRAIIHKGDTVEAARLVPDESLDFVFIDAAHTEKAVRADIKAWAPKVKHEGVILGHDWNWGSVQAALDDLLPGWAGHDHAVWSYPKAEYRP